MNRFRSWLAFKIGCLGERLEIKCLHLEYAIRPKRKITWTSDQVEQGMKSLTKDAPILITAIAGEMSKPSPFAELLRQ